MTQEISGEYTRRETGLKYTYKVRAQEVSGVVTCDAMVWRDGELKGNPTTIISNTSFPAAGPIIRIWISDTIERLIALNP